MAPRQKRNQGNDDGGRKSFSRFGLYFRTSSSARWPAGDCFILKSGKPSGDPEIIGKWASLVVSLPGQVNVSKSTSQFWVVPAGQVVFEVSGIVKWDIKFCGGFGWTLF